MRKSVLALTGLAIALASSPAMAEDAPSSSITVNGTATVVTDYRFRGISQTDKRFAVQGSLTLTHTSGFYVSTWGSSIDDYVAAGGDQEIDIIGGWSHTYGATTVDVGVLYYYYPGSGGANTDFVEPYASIKGAFGPVTAKLSAAYAPKSAALTVGNGKEDNLYVAGDLGTAVGDTGFSLGAHLGHSFGPSYLTIGKEYTDWNLTASYTWNHLTFGVGYYDTNKSAFSPTGRNISKAGVVGSIGVAF
ncbi:MAG: TorF family putative porin [Sphingobium sp.]|nr:TorF family putative porin [Sphingobium sp.]